MVEYLSLDVSILLEVGHSGRHPGMAGIFIDGVVETVFFRATLGETTFWGSISSVAL